MYIKLGEVFSGTYQLISIYPLSKVSVHEHIVITWITTVYVFKNLITSISCTVFFTLLSCHYALTLICSSWMSAWSSHIGVWSVSMSNLYPADCITTVSLQPNQSSTSAHTGPWQGLVPSSTVPNCQLCYTTFCFLLPGTWLKSAPAEKPRC